MHALWWSTNVTHVQLWYSLTPEWKLPTKLLFPQLGTAGTYRNMDQRGCHIVCHYGALTEGGSVQTAPESVTNLQLVAHVLRTAEPQPVLPHSLWQSMWL